MVRAGSELLLCLVMGLLIVLGTSKFIGKLNKKNEFGLVYQLKEVESDHYRYLEIECRSFQVLSVRIRASKQSPQLPRYRVFFQEDDNGLNMNYYTFMEHCHVDIQVNESEGRVELFRQGTRQLLFSIEEFKFEERHLEVHVKDPSRKWGIGERFQNSFHMPDGQWTIWNRDRPAEIDTGSEFQSKQTYGHQPIYLARSNTSKLFHLLYFKNVYPMNVKLQGEKMQWDATGGDAHFLLFIGQKQPEVLLKKYHKFIGAGHIPPFWAMGWHQSRWGYRSLNMLEEVVQQYQKYGLPLDTIWTDLEYMSGKQIFTVDQGNFPLARFAQLMKKVRYIPLVDAGVSLNTQFAVTEGKQKNVFAKLHNQDYVAQVWPGSVHFVDFLHPNATEYWVKMLGVLYSKIKFSGIWLDMNEPSNFRGGEPFPEPYRVQHWDTLSNMTMNLNVQHYNANNVSDPLTHAEVHAYYGHLEVMATYKFLESVHLRPFIITRSNSIGTGRFAGHWTGDNAATWPFLRLSIGANFHHQIFGAQMVGSDVCGFHLNSTAELCARWTQLGALYPFARNHNEIDSHSQQPYTFGQRTLRTAKMSLDFRYAILKQYYSIFIKGKGLGSIFRPLFLEFPSDEQCYNDNVEEEQFMIGEILMSTPILAAGIEQTRAYFPGNWYEVASGSVYRGWTTVTNALPSPPPVFIRSGRMLFLNNATTRTHQLTSDFKLKIGFQRDSTGYFSKGYIMSIGNYSDDAVIDRCLAQDCLYQFKAEMREVGQIQLRWDFVGPDGLNHRLRLLSIEFYFPDRRPIKQSTVQIVVEGPGMYTHEMTENT